MDIKTILLTKLNNVLNPKFENKFIFCIFLLWATLLWYQKIWEIFNSFELKIWDKYLKVTLQGWFDYINIFWIILIFIACYFFYKLTFNLEKEISFKTLKQASKSIKKILDENERIFKNHWPNSSASNFDKLRNEDSLKAWYSLEIEKILPNNEKIFNILKNIQKIDDFEKVIIDKMKNHIEAFRRHLDDNKYDYTEHQFPISFWYLINKYCKWWLLKDKYLFKYSVWLNEYISNKGIIIAEKYLFWSVLIEKNPYDIDVLIYCNCNLELDDYNIFQLLAKDFKNEFWQKLDITLFSKREENHFIQFREKILDLKNF